MLHTPQPNDIETLRLDDALKLQIPKYGADQLPPRFCSRYARLAADFIFDVQFPTADSWQMREKPHVFTRPADNYSFSLLARRQTVTPGMMVGIYCRGTEYDDGIRLYTHLALFLGQQQGQPLFLEQFGDQIRVMSLDDYVLDKLQIREVLGLGGDF